MSKINYVEYEEREQMAHYNTVMSGLAKSGLSTPGLTAKLAELGGEFTLRSSYPLEDRGYLVILEASDGRWHRFSVLDSELTVFIAQNTSPMERVNPSVEKTFQVTPGIVASEALMIAIDAIKTCPIRS